MANASVSRKILLALFVLFLVSLFGMKGFLAGFASLVPARVTVDFELWRLFAYPLVVDFIGLLVATICFSAPAEEVEQMLGGRRFSVLLLAVVLLSGVLHVALFYGTSVPMDGPANAALFMLVGFVYLFPHSEIKLIFFSVRSWVLLVFIGATILFISLLNWQQSGSSPLLFMSLGGFGLVLGALYFHVRFQKYAVLLRPIRSMERIVSSGRAVGASAPQRATVSQPSRMRMPFQRSAPRDVSDEERLNGILDRINERGLSSLSQEERDFLREYSGRL